MVTPPFHASKLPKMIRWRFFAFAPALFLVATPTSAQQVLFARGQWSAIQFDGRCEARAAALASSRQRPPAYAGFTFDPRAKVSGQFYARLGRSARPGSSVVLTLGERPFLLVGRGEWAWSRDARQDAAIAAAIRSTGSMRVEARDSGGRRSVDRYLLEGAATAIDSAAARCSQAGKSR